MCIGIPMQIVATQPGWSICEGRGERRQVDMILIGEQPMGAWLLVFQNTAREVLDRERAGRIDAALDAVAVALRGETVDVADYFADLVEREPQLPPHLRNKNPRN